MAYRIDEYRTAVLQYYEQQKAAGELRFNLTHPTPANLKDEALYVCSNRFQKLDVQLLADFFETQTDKSGYITAINKIDPDCFRPLINFLRGKTENPEIRQIELLAWLTDFKVRPYGNYIGVVPEKNLLAGELVSTELPKKEEQGQQKDDRLEAGNNKTIFERFDKIRGSKSSKYVLLVILGSSLFLLWPQQKHPNTGLVYVCDSPNATRYHLRKNCSGLRNCKHMIIQISVDSAKKGGRTLCHLEGG